MRKNIVIPLAVASTFAVGAYWYWSPQVALYEMRLAVHNADLDEFNEHVDYPKLRECLKGQLSDSTIERAGTTLGGMLGLALVDRMVEAVVRPEAVMHAMQNGKFKLQLETRSEKESKRVAAEVDIMSVQQALNLYKLDHGSYPTQEQGLKALIGPTDKPGSHETYMEKLPLDPWGRPYQYRNPGTQPGTVDVTYLPLSVPAQSTTGSSDSPVWHTERKNVNKLIVYVGDTEKPVGQRTGFVMTREGFAQWKLTEIRLPAAQN